MDLMFWKYRLASQAILLEQDNLQMFLYANTSFSFIGFLQMILIHIRLQNVNYTFSYAK